MKSKKFLSFLEAIKTDENKTLVDTVITGFNSCFEAGCSSCSPSTINGVFCHEEGCPDEWKDEVRECKWCGTEFKPEEAGQKFCDDSCYRSYNNIPEEDEGKIESSGYVGFSGVAPAKAVGQMMSSVPSSSFKEDELPEGDNIVKSQLVDDITTLLELIKTKSKEEGEKLLMELIGPEGEERLEEILEQEI